MNEMPQNHELLQWHPAFYAGIQIELEAEKENLIFENEHQLGTKPKQIDVLIIKKDKEATIHKNFGRIFRKINIIEYKSPTDYLSIDDFYKVYAYTCFYKADSEVEDAISVEELTISLFCPRYPRKLIHHLKFQRKYILKKVEPGIYYAEGDIIPIQIVITSRLSEKDNLWLKNLTNEMKQTASARELIYEYEKHKDNHLYRSVMDLIVRANREKFEEVKQMCEALEELMKDELDAARKLGMELGIREGKELGIQQGIQQGMQQGICKSLKFLIKSLRESGLTREQVSYKIMEEFSFSSEKTEEYMKNYW